MTSRTLRRRAFGALLTLTVSAALTGVTTFASDGAAVAAAATTPPACATADPNLECLHAPTADIAALTAPAFTTSDDPTHHLLTVSFTAAITPPYHQCPGGGVPGYYIPCSFAGLGVTGRIYEPGVTTPVYGATQIVGNVACDVSCPVTITLSGDFHGPATMILHFQIGELIIAANDLTTSTYESAIQLPAVPTKHAFHPTRPTVVLSGKLKSTTLHLAGKAGIPRSGVGGVLIRLDSTGEGAVKNADNFGNSSGTLEVVPGTTVKITKQYPGNITGTVMGWYSSGSGLTGSLVHVVMYGVKVHVAAAIHLQSAGVPLDATAAILAVNTPKGTSKVGGASISKSAYSQYVVVPLKAGAVLAVKAAKGTRIAVVGYTEPIQPVDEGSPMDVVYGQSLNGMFGLADPFGNG